VVHEYPLVDVDVARFPRLAEWHDGARTLALASAAERRPLRPGSGSPTIQDVSVGDSSWPDPQNALHVDTLFNTHKVWLYLGDVTEEIGPLVYVPRSHRLDATRLREEYRDSTQRNRCVDPSRRVGTEEVRRRRLEPVHVTCSANTMVIANTSGYHCRAPGAPGAGRRALHMSFRYDPFRYPLPTAARRMANLVRGVRP
jgi:hypothetical protein